MSRDWFESCGPDSEGAERMKEVKVSKFKVGDQVRIVANGWGGKYPVGHIGKVTEVFDGGIRVDEPHGNNYPNSNIELLARHTIKLNHQYTSKNGQKWECIAVRGDTAWLAGIFDGVADGAAYMYKLDGSAVCLASGSEMYDIKWEPVVEWVEREEKLTRVENGGLTHYGYKIRVPFTDGTPDFTQATVTPV